MKKKTISMLVAVIIASLLFTACGNQAKDPIEEETIELDYENMTAEDLIKDREDNEKITVDELLALLETYKYVEMDDRFVREDNITNEALELLREKEVEYPDITELLEKGCQSSEAVVRGEVLNYMTNLTGVADDHIKIAIDLANTEKNPYVLYQLTGVLGNEMADPEVAELIFKMSKHENPAIRNKAAYAIANPWSKGVEGVVERVIEMMDDEEEVVRKTVYNNAGRLADERVIDPIVKVLMDPEESDVHGDCMESLAYLWIDFPFFENTSEKAYKATIDYFKYTPRSEKVPSPSAMTSIKTKKSDSDSFEAWKEKATYYNPNDLVEPMFDILKDPETNWMACTSAIDLVKVYGSQEQFDSIKSIIESSEHPKKDLILDGYNTRASEK